MRKYHKSPISSHHSWLRSIVLLCVMIISASLASTASAQGMENSEAFYIYQNDGHFDGFFYDEVKQINYSRTDTLGVEHDHYVSQEIVTNDSTYRIMLTAIDSVSFVQPEIKFAKGVRFMQEEGLMAYFQSYSYNESQGHILVFNGSMPLSLQPKTGDVLTCRDVEGHDGMFVGKVRNVVASGGTITVYADYVDNYTDVFEQFITVEQVRNENTPLGAHSWSRTAGMSKGLKVEGNIDDFTLFNFSTSLEGKINLTNKVSLGFQASMGFGMLLKAAYNISLKKFYVKTELKEQIAAGFNVALDGEIYNPPSLRALPGVGALIDRFSKIPFPANFPVLYVTVMPEPFMRAEAHLKLNFSTGVAVKSLTQSFEMKDKYPFIDIKMGMLPYPVIPLTLEPSANWSISAQLNGMVQTGMKFPVEVGAEAWMRKFVELEASASLYVGPKINGELNLELINAITGKGMYESMKDSKVDLTLMSFDQELSGKGKFWGKGTELKKVFSYEYLKYPLQLFANISDAKYEIKGEMLNTVTAKFNTSGDVFLPQTLGFALYQKENDNDKDYTKLYRYTTEPTIYFLNNFNSVDLKIEDVAPGEYMVRPIVKTIAIGDIPVYSEQQLITIVKQDIELKPSEITAEEDGGEFDIEILNSILGDFTAVTYNDWVEATIQNNNSSVGSTSKKLHVTVKANDEEKYRTTTIAVRQVIGTNFVEKVLTVNQYGGIELSKSKISFTEDGGTESMEVRTSMRPINVNLNGADWLSYEINGTNITFTAIANTGEARTATVTISAWNSKTQGITTKTITIVQDAKKEDPSVPHVAPATLTFGPEGGKKTVQAYVGSQYNRVGYAIQNDAKGWVTKVDNWSDYSLDITVSPNVTGSERKGTVTVYMAKFDGDAPAPGTKTEAFPVTIIQKSAAVQFGEVALKSLSSFTLNVSALMQNTKTGASSVKEYSETFSAANATITPNGKTIHVVATNNYKSGYDSYQNVVSFDLTAASGTLASCKVENLEFRRIYEDTYIDFTQPGIYGKGDDIQIALTNVPFQRSLTTYVSGQPSNFVFDGDAKRGVNFKSLTHKKVNYTEEQPTENYVLVNSNENSATLTINAVAEGELP